MFGGCSLESLGDLDGDGDDEVLLQYGDGDGSPGDGGVRVIEADPTDLLGIVEPILDVPWPASGLLLVDAVVEDVDHNGVLDVAVAMRRTEAGVGEGAVAFWLNGDIVSQAPPVPAPRSPAPRSCATGPTPAPTLGWLGGLVVLRRRRDRIAPLA